MSETARGHILKLLADLNRKRYHEVDQGLHGSTKAQKNNQNTKKNSKSVLELALTPEPTRQSSNQTKNAIHNFLLTSGGQHGKVNIFNNVRMNNSEWEAAIRNIGGRFS